MIGITTVVVLLVVSTPAWSLLGNLVSELFIFVCAWGAVLQALRARADGEVPPVETPACQILAARHARDGRSALTPGFGLARRRLGLRNQGVLLP